MDTEREERRYLIVIQLDKSSDMQRLARDVPVIQETLGGVTKAALLLAFRSSDGTLFGFLVKTATLDHFIRAEFEKCKSTTNKDSFLIIEFGEKFNGIGFSRAWTWLQHH